MSKVTLHCLQKVHEDGSCACTLSTMDTMGKVKGQTIEMQIIPDTSSKGALPKPNQPLHVEPAILQEMNQPVKTVSRSLIKLICLECNSMYDVTDDIVSVMCKCGHQISFMVKKHAP